MVLGLVAFALLSACHDEEPRPEPTPYSLEIPAGFPTQLNIPPDNPLTVEGVRLGRYLFYDGRLAGKASEGKYMSCGTCHLPQNSFEIGLSRPAPIGLSGDSTYHTMLPLINLVWNPGNFGWNGSVKSIEEDVLLVMSDPTEFDSSPEACAAAIEAIPGYPPLFEAAFGTSEVTPERIAMAIAQFVRTIIVSDSRFDRYLRGELQLTSAELRGFVLFTTEEGADCFHCHGGAGNPLFTTHQFYNNGKDTDFSGEADRYSVTGDPQDRGAYKAPTLRNAVLTGPYMHDGRFKTLEEVIDFYSHYVVWSPYIDPLMHHVATGGVQLTPDEKSDLLAFLLALTDSSVTINPDFAPPETFP
ncbi:MAG: cytochrome c peroxidase [Bacteroidales bacterium]